VANIKKTPLNNKHKNLGAKMIDFGGWEMPVHYSSIIKEHKAVRQSAGLFDVSHMGEVKVSGKDALANLQKILSNNIEKLNIGQATYTVMCNSDGGIKDDFLVYRIAEKEYLLIVNASNIEKDYNWIKENLKGEVSAENLSEDYGLLALQGPKSEEILEKITDIDLSNIKYFRFADDKVGGIKTLISRTGYTGEKGFELYCDSDDVEDLWNAIVDVGDDFKLKPAGLGARNTLRLEKKLCLYGNDIDENTNPLEAGLGFAVDLDKDDFIGKEKILEVKNKGIDKKLIGFKLVGRGIPRHGYDITKDEKKIGRVTSGSFSPSLDENIGLGYVNVEEAEIGNEIDIMIRNRKVKAKIVKTPFI